MATVSVANPVVSVMLGALVLLERLDRDPPWHAVVASASLGLALFGAVVDLVRPREGPRGRRAEGGAAALSRAVSRDAPAFTRVDVVTARNGPPSV